MSIKFRKIRIFQISLISAVMLVGITSCRITANSGLPTITSIPAPSATPSQIKINTSTNDPVISPTQSKTFTPTVISKPTDSFTPTPVVTLSPSQAESRFLDWFKGSPVCRFPCWAGIVPGITSWDEAIQIIDSVVEIKRLYENSECYFGNCDVIHWENTFRPNTDGFVVSKADNVVYGIALQSKGSSIPEYDINELFTIYGVPDQIYISTTDFFGEEPLPFELILVYPQDEFIIRYFRNAWIEGENIVNCGETDGVTLSIGFDDGREWDPPRVMEITYAGQHLESVFLANLDTVTEYTIESFYEAFIRDSDTCISTPRELWP